MANQWRTERIFLTVKAYPAISKTKGESCCMAGVTAAGEWIRLFPVPFRYLADDQKFRKYTWIEGHVKRSSDPREASHYIDPTPSRLSRLFLLTIIGAGEITLFFQSLSLLHRSLQKTATTSD